MWFADRMVIYHETVVTIVHPWWFLVDVRVCESCIFDQSNRKALLTSEGPIPGGLDLPAVDFYVRKRLNSIKKQGKPSS